MHLDADHHRVSFLPAKAPRSIPRTSQRPIRINLRLRQASRSRKRAHQRTRHRVGASEAFSFAGAKRNELWRPHFQVYPLNLRAKVDHLTDYYSANDINGLLARNGNLLNAIHESMRVAREPEDSRTNLSKEVSYKVDAHNIFLPSLNSLHPKKIINFVCSGRVYNWTPDNFLKSFQRSPLFLIMLLANLYENGQPLPERIRTLGRLLDEQIGHGKYLLEYVDSHATIPAHVESEIEVYIYRHYTTYIDMAKRLSKSRPENDATGERDRMPSYNDYLEMMDGRKRTVERSMRAIHAMIDDRRDDQYRDFIDDNRIQRALSTLKLG